jgi:hypothetical protein
MNPRRGQSLIESALILTAFMALLLGMASVGQTLFIRQTLADRARVAARWGALNPYDPAKIRAMAEFGAIPASDIEVSNPGCPGPACRILVAIPAHGIRAVEPVTALEDVPKP